MKFLALLTFYLFFSLVSLSQTTDHKLGDNFIVWKEGLKLKWEDFQGQPDIHYTENPRIVAMTYSLTRMSNDNKKIKILVVFEKNKSYKTKAILKPEIFVSGLIHEQIHFDISELFGRKLRKKIAQKEKDSNVWLIFDQIGDEEDIFQEEYDNSTDFGRNPKIQAIWVEKIKNLLAEYAEWVDKSNN